MTHKQELLSDPRVAAANDELRRLITSRYPEATFSVDLGHDPEGVYLAATVDTNDLFDLIDVVSDRLVDLQIDEGLPVYFLPLRPLERNLAVLREQLQRSPHLCDRAVGA